MENLNLTDIENIDFWKSLNPDLNITKTPFQNQNNDCTFDPDLQSRLRKQIIEEGYFQTPVILGEKEISVLSDAVVKLNSQNIMPIFAALYDEFWVLLQSLRNSFTSFLHDDYRLIPDFWIWHIDADDQSAGWKPHRDGSMEFNSIRNDGTPTLCTAWIPLRDVETTNSCMYVLPRKYDAIFQDFVRKRAGLPGIENATKIPIPLTRIRALPVKAGAIVGWDTNLFHWGSGSSKWATGPRISIGVYYEASDSKETGIPYNSDQKRFVDYCKTYSQLSFEDRLVIIANIINNYTHKFDIDGEVEKGFTAVIKSFQEKWRWKG